MHGNRHLPRYLPRCGVAAVTFEITGDHENKRDSSVNITDKNTIGSNGLPVASGIYDAKMGTTDKAYRCTTCYNIYGECPGHSGSIALKFPVQNSLFKDDIFKILKVTCLECGAILPNARSVTSAKDALKEQVKNARVTNKDKGVICLSCGAEHPNIVRSQHDQLQIFKEYMVDGKLYTEPINNKQIAAILDRISDADLPKIGRNKNTHPRKLILNVINIPSNTIRPDTQRNGSKVSSSNDITAGIKLIVDLNNKLPENLDTKDREKMQTAILMDMMYYELVKGSSISTKTRVTHANGKAIDSLAGRLPKKQGMVRYALMGKRVHMSCRSVISCDPSMKITELGVPVSIARIIQVPTRVHPWNIEELNRYFANKNTQYPGCVRLYKASSGKTYSVSNIKPEIILEVGDILYRNVIDGDVIAFNRAPTFSPAHISSHIVRVKLNGNTLSFNVSACNMYSADFDGDEMTGHFPHSTTSKIEIKHLLSPGEHMIGIQYGGPILGLFQDALIGSALFTLAGQTFSKYDAMRLMACTDDAYFITLGKGSLIFDKEEYTNYEMVTKILPEINFTTTPQMYDPNLAHIIKYDKRDTKVVIDRGTLVSGIIDKKSVGQTTFGSIIHVIHNNLGSKIALDFIYNMQQLISQYLKYKGVSLGISDMLVSKQTLARIHAQTNALIENSKKITERLDDGNIIPPVGMTVEEYYEQLQRNALKITDEFYSIIMEAAEMDIRRNRLYQIIASGSKGNNTNFTAISSALGQQTMNGARMPMNFGYNRSLPYFPSFSTTPESRGFIANSYITGMKLTDLIASSMDARYSLIAQALITARTGAQSRISVKNLESIVVNNRRICAKGINVISLVYGDSGFDPRALELCSIPTSNISTADFEKYHVKTKVLPKKFQNTGMQKLLDEEFQQLTEDRTTFRNIMLKMEWNSGINNKLYGDRFKTPLNMVRIITDVKFAYKATTDLNPGDAITKINELCKFLPYTAFNEIMKNRGIPVPQYWDTAQTFTRILIRSYLNVHNLLANNIDNAMLGVIIDKIDFTLKNAYIAYGTAVGILAAQSMSEPLTQFVLDSKHRSGGSGTKTDTIERMTEILVARPSDKMKNTSMVIQVAEEHAEDISKVQEIANHIEMMNVGRFIANGMIPFYEKFGEPIHPNYKHEAEMIAEFLKLNPLLKPPSDLTPWCIRFELNRREMILKNMSLDSIIRAIQANYKSMFIVYTSEISKVLIVRCYMRADMIKKDDVIAVMKSLITSISEIVIRGIPGILQAEVSKEQLLRSYVDTDGSIKTRKIYYITTNGTNLRQVLSHPMIDPYGTQTDSIVEIAEVFGIEAAYEKIINELKTINSATIEKGISYGHCVIYASEMTRTGFVTSIERTGNGKREAESILLRVSTASPVQVLEEAAKNNITDNLSGISSHLMLGGVPRVGSTYNQVIINEDFIKSRLTNVNNVLDDL